MYKLITIALLMAATHAADYDNMTAAEKTAYDAMMKVKQDGSDAIIDGHKKAAGYDTMTDEEKLAFDKKMVD